MAVLAHNVLDDDCISEGLYPEVSSGTARLNINMPATNILETNDTIVIEVAATGMEKCEFLVDIEGEILLIKAQKKIQARKAAAYTYREFDFNGFCRSFSLPKTAEVNEIYADYINGIFHVRIPKKTAGMQG